MHTDAHVRIAGNASPAFAEAWKLFLDSISGTHRAHFVSQRSMLLSDVLETVTYILSCGLVVSGGGSGYG